MGGHKARVAYRIFAALRVLLSLAWLVLLFIWSDRAALFFSGALVATHATMMVLVLLAALGARLRQLPAIESPMLMAAAVSDVAGVLGIVLYAVNVYGAGLQAQSAADCSALPAGSTAVTQLSCAMWSREPGVIVVILALLGTTFLMHVATVIMVAMRLRRLSTALESATR